MKYIEILVGGSQPNEKKTKYFDFLHILKY